MMEEAHCRVCGRPLAHPVSVARRIGPVCAGVGHWPPPRRRKEPDPAQMLLPLEMGYNPQERKIP